MSFKRVLATIKSLLKAYWILLVAAIILAVLRIEGLWFLVAWMYVYILYRIWMMRKQMAYARKQIESMIWGKPLQREYWEKGEMKNTKVKFVWGKKDAKDKH